MTTLILLASLRIFLFLHMRMSKEGKSCQQSSENIKTEEKPMNK